MNERTAELQEIKKQYELTAAEIAKMMDRDVNTVYQWLSGRRVIPVYALRVLKLKVTRK